MKFRILWRTKPSGIALGGLTVYETNIRAKTITDARKKFVKSEEGKVANLQTINVIDESERKAAQKRESTLFRRKTPRITPKTPRLRR